MPEKEEWVYDGTKQYVCSAFVAGMFYHGGMLGDITIVPQE
jgi:hypothetical protein